MNSRHFERSWKKKYNRKSLGRGFPFPGAQWFITLISASRTISSEDIRVIFTNIGNFHLVIGKIKACEGLLRFGRGCWAGQAPLPCVNRPRGDGFVNMIPKCPPRLLQLVPTGWHRVSHFSHKAISLPSQPQLLLFLTSNVTHGKGPENYGCELKSVACLGWSLPKWKPLLFP